MLKFIWSTICSNILSKLNTSLPESDAERCVVLLNGIPSSHDTRLVHNPLHVQKPPSPCRCCGPVIRPDLPAKSGPQVAHGHPRSSRSHGSACTVGPDGSLSSSLSNSNPSHFDPLVSQLVSARDSSSSVEGCFCKVLESLNKACTCNLLCYRLHEKRKNSLIEVTKSRTKCGAPNVKGGKS